ncbi:MAG: lipoyl synthase [Candidatus Omnitrophota bacterium]|nr:lipoyl synthase [Candidatus Omnitrophota bacterium]
MNRLPPWFKQGLPNGLYQERLNLFKDLTLNTVCQSAHCPNMGFCFKQGRATFLILGDICTRNCRFCAVKKGNPQALNLKEPSNLAKTIQRLNLNYVAITSVTRDDLNDGGASQFVRCVREISYLNASKKIELLIPDFQGKRDSLGMVIGSKPDVICHNLETVFRLYAKVRPKANYALSLKILSQIKQMDKSIFTKSGIMLGLGEREVEVIDLMQDLRQVNCDILTIGQYLAPSKNHLPVERFLLPEEFDKFKGLGLSLGFKCVQSAPLVRSSYMAQETFRECLI